MDKNDHLVKWEDVCRPRHMGDLGMGRIKEKNMALMGKWLWRFSTEGDALWYSTIFHKYGYHSNGRDSNFQTSTSWSLLWKNICHLYSLFLPFTKFAIGNGLSIKFWKDFWWGEATLTSLYPRLFSISTRKEAAIAEILLNSPNGLSWNLIFSRELYDWEA